MVPPLGMASRPLTARLTMTCSNWLRSNLTGHRSRPWTSSSLTLSPSSRCSSIDRSESVSDSVSTCGRSVWRREKASSWRTRPAARLAFCLMFMMSWKDGSLGRWLASSRSEKPMMAVEHVVEVVGDAAGELADRFHLLLLAHLMLQRPLLGDVDDVDDHHLAAAGALGDRIDEEAAGALALAGERRVDRRDDARRLRRRRRARRRGWACPGRRPDR